MRASFSIWICSFIATPLLPNYTQRHNSSILRPILAAIWGYSSKTVLNFTILPAAWKHAAKFLAHNLVLSWSFPSTLLNSIGKGAFCNCYELKSLKLPSSVQSAGVNTFYGCSKLVPSTISTSDDNDNAPILAFLHKPQSERDALMLANPPNWRGFGRLRYWRRWMRLLTTCINPHTKHKHSNQNKTSQFSNKI